jgi:CRP-like cAMP-binding protein
MTEEILKKIYFFEGLTQKELSEITKICQNVSYKKGDIIFKEGSFGDKFYIITKGAIRISKVIPNIGEEALAVLKSGDYFGEMALIDDFPRSADAIANEDAVLMTISKSDLDNLLYFNKEIAYKLLWTFCRTLSTRLRETNEKLVGFFALGKF